MSKKARQTPKTAKFKKPVNRPPLKVKNNDVRTREYLTEDEIEILQKAVSKETRNSTRNHSLVLLMFRHGFRVGEITTLKWEQIDMSKALLHVKRIKNGIPSTHPIWGKELRLLRQLKRESKKSPYVFLSERGAPITDRSVRNLIKSGGEMANFPFPIHAHMLRHSTGFYLANQGYDTRAIQSYLGHSNIKNTVIYTVLSHHRFKNFWRD